MSNDAGVAWYENVSVGKNTLSTMIKHMYEDAGVKSKTNHRMRAFGATAMFQSNVPECVIQRITRHRSLNSLQLMNRFYQLNTLKLVRF